MMAALTFVVLATSIVALTIAGGGLFPLTVGLVATVLNAFACFVLLTRPHTLTPGSTVPPAKFPLLEWIMAAMLLLILISTVPLPPPLDPVAGSPRHEQNQAVVSALQHAYQVGIPVPDPAPWFALSRNRAGSLRFFLLLGAAFGAFSLVASWSARAKINFLYFLALLGTAVGIAGWLGQWKIPQGDTIWWFIPIPHAPTSPVGCFLNRNHFGGFVAMLCPVALALVDHAFRQRRWISLLFHLALTGVMMTVVALSLSRGAMLALGAGLAVTSIMIAFRHRAAWGLALLIMTMVAGALVISQSAPVRERLAGIHNPTGISSVQSRLAEWRESLRVWPHYPLLGAGMNALRMVYPQHRETSVGARLIHAENEYIQLLVESGLIGLGLTLAGIAAWWCRVKQNAQSLPGVLPVAAIGAMTVTLVHCSLDFPAHLPLYALVLGSIAGLLLLPSPADSPVTRRVWALAPALIAFTGSLILSLHHPAELKNLDDPAYLYTAKYRDLQKALVWAPTSHAWIYLGRALYKEGSTRGSPELCSTGESFITRAALLDPKNYRLWYELGETRLALKDFDRANEAFLRARQLRAWLTPPPIPGRP